MVVFMPEEFHVNHPFVFFIRDLNLKTNFSDSKGLHYFAFIYEHQTLCIHRLFVMTQGYENVILNIVAGLFVYNCCKNKNLMLNVIIFDVYS